MGNNKSKQKVKREKNFNRFYKKEFLKIMPHGSRKA